MDLSRVYRKTQQGEEALKGRTRLHGQRLRSLLILVDGQATAKELCDKVGSKYRPRATLGQLEHLGLIEPMGGAPAPDNREEDLPIVADAVEAEEALAAASEAPATEPAPEPQPAPPAQAEPEFQTPAAPEPESESPAAAAASSTPVEAVVHSPPPTQEVPAAADAAAAGSPEVVPEPEQPAAVAGADAPAAPQEQDANATDPGLEPVVADEQPQRPSPLAEAFDSPQSRHEDRIAVESLWQRLASATEPLRRREWKLKRPAPRLWWVLAPASVVVLALLAALALSWGSYRATIERHAAAVIGQPVRIGGMSLALFPPGLTLQDVDIGAGRLAQASVVRASVSIHGWSDVDPLTIDLAIDGLTLQQAGAAALCGAARLDPAGVRRARLHVVDVSNLSLALGNSVIQDLRGAIEFDRARGATAVSLSDADNRLRATLAPQGKGCRFAATGNNWRLPLRGGLMFFGLNAQGSFDENGMQLTAFDARVSDGIVSGNGELDWSPRANLELRLELRHVDLAKLLPALGLEALAHGPLDAKLQISARPASLGALGETLSGRGNLSVAHGSVDRFDLAEAARTITPDAVRGGATRFEQLTAQIQFERGNAALRNLHLDAGALQADGHVAIDNRNRLGGAVTVQIRGSTGQLRVPLQVGGTLAAPELTPAPNPDPSESAAAPQSAEATPSR
jgi:hypothetical protein